MADTKREIERKYESDDGGLPDLTRVPGVATVLDKGVTHLDATYHDTTDERLAASLVTLRRRTGGSDAGWHLKFPVAPGVRDEIRAPLSDTLPDELAALVRSRVRDGELLPVVRLRSDRDVRHLVGLKAQGRGIPRPEMKVASGGNVVGEVTSGTFSPTLRIGIGLALVKSIAEGHGGTAEARSDGLDRGSEFIVRLPVNRSGLDSES